MKKNTFKKYICLALCLVLALIGIKTAGAISDISYQLLMRSSPSYLAAHNEILLAAWARYLEAKFEAQLLALGTATGNTAPTTVATTSTVRDDDRDVAGRDGQLLEAGQVDLLPTAKAGGFLLLQQMPPRSRSEAVSLHLHRLKPRAPRPK